MKCWYCKNAETVTQGELNGGEYQWQGETIPWCNKFNESLEQIKDYGHDIANCENYESEAVIL